MITQNRVVPLRDAVTGQDRQQQSHQEQYVPLKNAVFEMDFARAGVLDPLLDVGSDLVGSYVPKAVTPTDFEKGRTVDRFGEELIVDSKKELGSDFIKEIKRTNKEPGNLLTYEHLHVERIHHGNMHIVLVGATGSGKTHMLEYVWQNYIDRLLHCPKRTRQVRKCVGRRLRLKMDVDQRNCRDEDGFYLDMLRTIAYAVESNLSTEDCARKYQQYVAHLFTLYHKNHYIAFMHRMLDRGLTNTDPIPLKELARKCPKSYAYDVLLFALQFCGWLRVNYCPKGCICIFVLLDNMDGSPEGVQRGVIKLLTNTTPKESALIVCACRPETLRKWKDGRRALDIVPHIGVSAYDVVMHRIQRFLNQEHDQGTLSSMLQSKLPPSDFLNNMRYLYRRLDSYYFKNLFQDHFGWQVRHGLIFAQCIVDIAASRQNALLEKSGDYRSNLAFERLLYSPWGLESRSGRLVNVFAHTRNRQHRLAALRIILFLSPFQDYACRVRDVCDHLKIFGLHAHDCLDIMNKLIASRVIICSTKENLTLDRLSECRHEELRITEIGRGLLRRYGGLNYVEACMYFSLCNSANYRVLGTTTPKLDESLDLVRRFIAETWEIEKKELDYQKSTPYFKVEYNQFYNGRTITLDMIDGCFPAMVRILLSERKKQTRSSYAELFPVVQTAYSDMLMVIRSMKNDYGLEPKKTIELHRMSIEFEKLLESTEKKDM